MSRQTATRPVRPETEGNKTTVTAPADEPIIVLRRRFPAPAALVYEVTTTPEYVRRWYGCGAMQMTVCEIDLRVGGGFRYALVDGDGNRFGFDGTYLELDPPRRIVHTERFDGYPDAVSTVTIELDERDGQTHLTSTIRHGSMAARDGHLAAMGTGTDEAYARIEALLRERLATPAPASAPVTDHVLHELQ